ncbi:hypothetical protein [Asticcacaulis solisilvae]|uniref:hypothetical protein n=1 Tax=Asticcacaulis solisilvae TaxID=1217274 RepID=UPI003FD75719
MANVQVSEKPKIRQVLHTCYRCGAKVRSARMPNGGWGHFETAEGLTRVQHACYYIGKGLSKRRDDKTLDLFDQDELEAAGDPVNDNLRLADFDEEE